MEIPCAAVEGLQVAIDDRYHIDIVYSQLRPLLKVHFDFPAPRRFGPRPCHQSKMDLIELPLATLMFIECEAELLSLGMGQYMLSCLGTHKWRWRDGRYDRTARYIVAITEEDNAPQRHSPGTTLTPRNTGRGL